MILLVGVLLIGRCDFLVVLVVNSHGFKLGRRRGRLIISYADGSKKEVPISRISVIVISARGSLSTDVIRELSQNNIPIIFAGNFSPYAVLHPYFMHATVVTRREQMRALSDYRGFQLAKSFCFAATINKVQVLRYFAKSRERIDSDLSMMLRDAAARIEDLARKIRNLEGSLVQLRLSMMGLEGEGARIYYDMLRYLVPPELGFKGRERRPPRDPVNSVLSYGYTILNSIILLSIAKTGLEPFAGFLHVDRSGKPSLILDLSEEFRQPIVDVLAISLFSKKRLKLEHFSYGDNGMCLLNDAGKEIFYEAFNKRLLSRAYPGDKNYTFENAIMRQARNIARFLIGKIPSYDPFIWRWS